MYVTFPWRSLVLIALGAWLAFAGAAGCSGDSGDPAEGAPDGGTPPPFELEHRGGTVAQGSIFWGDLVLVDPEASFDAVLASDGIFVTDPVAVTTEGAHVDLVADEQGVLEPGRLTVSLEVDTTAPAGWLGIELRYADGRSMSSPQAIEIAARTPVELESGVEVEGALDRNASQLYRLGLDGPAIVSVAAPELAGNVGMPMLLGPSGSYDDLRSVVPRSATIADEQVYVVAVAFAPEGETGRVRYDLTTRLAPLGDAVAEDAAGPHEGAAEAQPVELPVTVRDGEIAYEPVAGFEDDWYRIEIGAGDAGRTLVASIEAGVDTYPTLRLFAADGTTVVGEVAYEGIDVSNHRRTLFSDPLEAGTYYVEATADLILPDPIPYTLGLALMEVQP